MYTNIKDENNLKSIFFYKNYIYIYIITPKKVNDKFAYLS